VRWRPDTPCVVLAMHEGERVECFSTVDQTVRRSRAAFASTGLEATVRRGYHGVGNPGLYFALCQRFAPPLPFTEVMLQTLQLVEIRQERADGSANRYCHRMNEH
jgi:hypothetical protein